MNFFVYMQCRRYPALGALVVLLALARVGWWAMQHNGRSSRPDTVGPPTYRAASAEVDAMLRPPPTDDATVLRTEEQTRTILDSIRYQGRRVSLHPRIGGIVIRATSLANPDDVISAEVNDATQSAAVNELHCAQALARKLGLTIDAGPTTQGTVQPDRART